MPGYPAVQLNFEVNGVKCVVNVDELSNVQRSFKSVVSQVSGCFVKEPPPKKTHQTQEGSTNG